mmetsp:Transcript_6492/g.4877  ORF Transcript_6492/g.4877 Transcript_6492/m.4877 type:complete len:92 (+) Transcript_6492:319-594(+)
MATYYKSIVLPPQTFLYEPQIFGFKLFGKRGSKYFTPVEGVVKYSEDEENVDSLVKKFKEELKVSREEQPSQQKSEKKGKKHRHKHKKHGN